MVDQAVELEGSADAQERAYYGFAKATLLLAHERPADALATAREVFAAVYDGLAGPAQEHVRAVVAAAGAGPRLDIQAHTVDEMHAGIRHTAS